MDIKRLRKAIGLTQEELSERIGVHENTIRLWEQGLREPRLSDMKKLCEVLGCSELELLNGPSSENWELRLLVKNEGVIDMTTSKSSAVLNVGDDAMAITLSAGYDLWEDDAKFEELIEQLRRKRAVGLKTRKEDW